MIVSIITLIITAFLSFNFGEEIIKQNVEDQLVSESSTRGNAIRTLYETRIKDVQILSTSPMIQFLVSELDQYQSNSLLVSKAYEKRRDFQIEVKAFRELIGYSIGFADVKIIGNQGDVFFSLGSLKDNNFGDDPKFIRGLSESFVEIEPTATGERKMVIVVPIFANDKKTNPEPIGVMIADMSTVEIDKILLNRSGLGKTGEIYLVDSNHLMISESRFLENAAFKQKVNTMPVQKCFEEGKDAGGLYSDYLGNLIYGFSYCAKDLGFVLIAEKDQSETIQPILSLQNKIFLAGIILTICVGVITFFLSKSLSKPIIKLRNAADKIAGGDFGTRTNIQSGDEIGQLSSAFDSMATKIQESLITIRQREDVIKQQQDLLLQFSDQSENYLVSFLDVIDSTKITAKLSDLESSKLYSIFLNSMASIVRDFNGIVVKNIGDALLFYFPKTNSQDKDSLRNAIECCLTIGDFNKEINKKLEQDNLPSLGYKISATYGSVRVAKIASSSIDDIFGSTVNKCAKINRFAPTNGLVIGNALYEIIKSFDGYDFKLIDNPQTQEYGQVYSVMRK